MSFSYFTLPTTSPSLAFKLLETPPKPQPQKPQKKTPLAFYIYSYIFFPLLFSNAHTYTQTHTAFADVKLHIVLEVEVVVLPASLQPLVGDVGVHGEDVYKIQRQWRRQLQRSRRRKKSIRRGGTGGGRDRTRGQTSSVQLGGEGGFREAALVKRGKVGRVEEKTRYRLLESRAVA